MDLLFTIIVVCGVKVETLADETDEDSTGSES